jgi:hypothetical protein
MTVNGNGAGEHLASELLEVERLTNVLSAEWLEQHAVMPMRLDEGRLTVATWTDRVEPLVLDDLRLHFGADITLARFGEHDLRSAIRRLYAQEATTAEGLIAGMAGSRLSSTVIDPNSSRRSGTSAIPIATRSSMASSSSARPSNITAPSAGRMPITALSSVVFPAPLAPMTVTMLPGCMARDTPRTASTLA